MIVGGSYFSGDDDLSAAWQQHDVYRRALWIIVSAVNRYTRLAKIILNDYEDEKFGEIESFDHRTIQCSHDLLAAAWRFEFCKHQLNFIFMLDNVEISLADRWLNWLSSEVDAWIDCPNLIRLVRVIICHQNNQEGHAAESLLGLAILDRFSQVPWDPSWRAAFQADFQKNSTNKKC